MRGAALHRVGRLRRPGRLAGGRHPHRTVAQQLLDPLDRVAFAIQQLAYALQQGDVLGAIVPAATAALQRPDLIELGLPEPQDVRRDLEVVRHLADRAERRRSEEHTSELQSLMRLSYAVFCLKKKT